MNGLAGAMEVSMRRIARSSIWLLVLLMALPVATLGQEVKAGVATIVEGTVTARRQSRARPVALRFRDDVFRKDTIVTAERSLARLLLGGKATVTVREQSRLTVTEVPGASLIDLGTGKLGLAVARERMRPGDVVEVRTPNAIIAVRGTVIVTELVPLPTAKGSKTRAWQSNVYVLTGKVEVQELRGGVRVGPVYLVAHGQMITISPLATPQVTSFPPSRVAEITAGLHPTTVGPKGAPTAAKETALRAVADDVAAASIGDEQGHKEWNDPRAPIEPRVPTLADSGGEGATLPDPSPGVPSPSPSLPGPVATLPGAPSSVGPAQPPVTTPPPSGIKAQLPPPTGVAVQGAGTPTTRIPSVVNIRNSAAVVVRPPAPLK